MKNKILLITVTALSILYAQIALAQVLKEVYVKGLTVFSKEEIKPLYQDYVDKNISKTDKKKIAEGITDFYYKNGYILSFVSHDNMHFKNGNLVIHITEGDIYDVFVEGKFKKNGLIMRYSKKILEDDPLTRKTYEHYIMLAKRLPGIDLSAMFIPPIKNETKSGIAKKIDEDEVADLVISGEKYDYQGTFGINNHDVKDQGRIYGELAFDYNSFITENGKVTFETMAANHNESMKYFSLSLQEPVNDLGGRISARAIYSDINAPIFVQRIHNTGVLQNSSEKFKGSNKAFELYYSQPWVLSRFMSHILSFSFMANNDIVKENDTKVDGSRTRILGAGIQSEYHWDESSTSMFRFEYQKGLSGMGASKFKTTDVGKLNFSRLLYNISHMQNFTENLGLGINISGQESSDHLLGGQQFGLGGRSLGRGFKSNIISGESGIAGSVSLEYMYGFSGDSPLLGVEPFAFYDFGKVYHKAKILNHKKTESLSSAGAGLRFLFEHNVNLEATYAKPLTLTQPENETIKKKQRLFFGLTYMFKG